MRARIKEKQEVAKGTLLVTFDLLGEDADAAIPGLRLHLEGCPACREEHDSLRALVSGEQAL